MSCTVKSALHEPLTWACEFSVMPLSRYSPPATRMVSRPAPTSAAREATGPGVLSPAARPSRHSSTAASTTTRPPKARLNRPGGAQRKTASPTGSPRPLQGRIQRPSAPRSTRRWCRARMAPPTTRFSNTTTGTSCSRGTQVAARVRARMLQPKPRAASAV